MGDAFLMDKSKVIKRIKDGGSLMIYVGTASLMKPYIMRDNEERSIVGKVCSTASGTVISIGIAGFANKVFGKIVDEVADFIDDIRKKPSKSEESGESNA